MTAPHIALPERVQTLNAQVRRSAPGLCAERAVLVTRYFRKRRNRRKPVVLAKAEALAHVLRNKEVRIHPDELLVGNFTRYRVGGGVYPELHGVPMLEDLFRFPRRPTNPLAVSRGDTLRLLFEVVPFWLPRFVGIRAHPLPRALRFLVEQLNPTTHLVVESAGISHFVPDYAGLVTRGTEGYREAVATRRREVEPGSAESNFLDAVDTVCDGLDAFAAHYQEEADRLAEEESDEARRVELQEIAAACAQVPQRPARTLREALQSMLFAQIALNLESLDNSVCPGRLDQILYPFYQRDREEGVLDWAGAFELLGCFAVKLCEIVPGFSRRFTRFMGGMFNGQVVVVGGTDAEGNDATNELTHMFLALMDQLRTRQPNYHARVHPQSPPEYRAHLAEVLAAGGASPALYNDAVIVPVLRGRGISEPQARDYATVGCVEPVSAGRSFFSTDAALFNLPLCLELALNEGRRFGHRRRIGAPTGPAELCASTEDLVELFRVQVAFAVGRMLEDLRAVERANARLHPTPLTSMLLRGCIDAARDATAGGALYNGGGVQGIGPVEVGDSLAAVETVVFRQGRASMAQLVEACRDGFRGAEALQARLREAPKYGNDDPIADAYVGRAMELYAGALDGEINTRGGAYAAGFYSVTAHEAFGEVVGALPSGRVRGEPFSSGLSPGRGGVRKGPTAALLSAAHLPVHCAGNGVNFNLQLAPWTVAGESGVAALQGLIDGGFAGGCMQMQVNVMDPAVLIEARDNPGSHPELIVRVSGYSAYFDDLSPEMKEEVIDRWMAEDGTLGV
jgi:formate C-acetyltransferase